MAVVNKYTFNDDDVIVPTTLTASDTAVLSLSKTSVIIVSNDTAGALTLNIKGDTATSIHCPGVGSIDLTGGLDVLIGVGETLKYRLSEERKAWLGDGNVTLTGAVDATAYILET